MGLTGLRIIHGAPKSYDEGTHTAVLLPDGTPLHRVKGSELTITDESEGIDLVRVTMTLFLRPGQITQYAGEDVTSDSDEVKAIHAEIGR